MKIHSYQNGNTYVELFDDGTKIRTTPDLVGSKLNFPESLDVKITNWCDAGCRYCHEKSDENGQHCDMTVLLDVLKELPKGVEIAAGGGSTLSHPELFTFLQVLKQRGNVANVTVNQKHISDIFLQTIIKQDLVKGVGISYSSIAYTRAITDILKLTDNVVFHLINGVNKPSDIDDLIKINNGNKTKILLLGYKDYGRGSKYMLNNNRIEVIKKEWQWNIRQILDKNIVMSFDNLAIEQTKVKRFFPEKEWEKFYMGKEFIHSMYVDAVEQKYAPTSTSDNRVDFKTKSLLAFFKDKG
jgi:organic radical activating enzyme